MHLFSNRAWFGIGRLGPYVAVPRTWEGWATFFGIALPAAIFAGQRTEPLMLLAIGLFAFLFGLSYAMAEEERRGVSEA